MSKSDSIIGKPAAGVWRPMRSAPKDGTSILLCHEREAVPLIAQYEVHLRPPYRWGSSHGLYRTGVFVAWATLSTPEEAANAKH